MLADLASPLAADDLRLVTDALDRSGNIVATLGRDGVGRLRVRGANAALHRVLGLVPGEIPGAAFPEVLGSGISEDSRQAIAAAVREATPLRTKIVCRRADGETVWLGFDLMPVDGNLFVLLARDITREEQDRKRQDTTQTLLAKVFMHVDVAVAVVDGDGQVLMCNPALERMMGRPATTIEGRPALELIAAEQRAAVLEARERQMKDGRPYCLPTTLLPAEGQPFSARLTAEAIEHSDLKRLRVVTFAPAPAAQASDLTNVDVTVGGMIRRIGLEPIRQAMGERWEQVAERALATAEHVVGKRIGDGDTFARTGDGALVICFHGISGDEATFRAAMIGREIRQRLLGADEGRTTAMPAGGSLPLASVAAQVPDVRVSKFQADRIIAEQLAAQRAEMEQRARVILQGALADATCRLDEVRQRNAAVTGYYAGFVAAAEQRILAAYQALVEEDNAAFDIDVLRLRLAAIAASDPDRIAAQIPVMVDISHAVFDSRRRTEHIVEFCRTLSEPLRERLVFMLSDRPAGLSEVRLLDCMQRLKPFCREIGFRQRDFEAPPLPDGRLAKLTIAVDHAATPSVPGVDDGFAAFARTMRAKSVRLLVRDVPSDAAARTVWEKGADLIMMRSPAR